MLTLLRLEGPDLESLLTRVHDELGPDARIVEAQKVRVGGLGGFFAKERFEVSVEVDQPEEETATTTAAEETPPMSLLDLTDRVDAEERAAATPHVPTPPTLPTEADAETVAALSTETPEFAAVLASLRGVGEGTQTPPVRTVREWTPPRVDALTQRIVNPKAVSPDAVSPEAVSPDAVGPTAYEEEPVEMVPAPNLAPPLPDIDPTAQPQPETPSDRTADTADTASTAGDDTAGTAGSDALPHLAALGLPARLMPDPSTLAHASAHTALVESLTALPSPPRPPSTAGEVLVVAGPVADALDAARQIARATRVDEASVLVAAPNVRGFELPADRHLSGSVAAERVSGVLHTADSPVLVVVDAPMDPESASWAREVIAALRPDAVWAVVDATRKPSDIAGWVTRLGGAEALAVHGTSATADPAALLGLDIAVSLLDGRRATPAAWVSLISERLPAGLR